MKRISIILWLALALVVPVRAHVLDGASRNMLRMAPPVAPSRADAPANYRSAILELDGDIEQSLAQLEERGAVILNRRNELVLACLPVDIFGDYEFAPHPNGVRRCQLARPMTANMNLARTYTGVDRVHAGLDGLPSGLDGSGIILGLADSGFDATHPAFADRVGMMVCVNDTLASIRVANGNEQVLAMGTDNPDYTHATHVANIMAGGYTAAGFHGVAPGADIAMAASLLLDVGILAGVEEIIDYARAMGKPAVINMSLGSYNGPHDGTDLFCRYLDRCAEDAIIVMSAGNEGGGKTSILHTFTPDQPLVTTTLQTKIGWAGNFMLGRVDVWSLPGQNFDMRVGLYDIDTRESWYITDWVNSADPKAGVFIDSSDERLAGIYEGRMALSTDVADSGRSCIVMDFDLTSLIKSEGHGWARYYLMLEVRGDEGTHVDMYADGEYTFFNNLSQKRFRPGDSSMSVSNIACGHNTLCIGAMVSREKAEAPDGKIYDWGFTAGTVASFSSYGTLIDGREMPLICAPGCYVVSATSHYFAEAHPGAFDIVADPGNTGAYWHAECGTSMSSPHAAGIFALWLQADPTLTTNDLRRIAAETADKDYVDIVDPRWGAGQINAVEGLRHILSTSVAAAKPDTSIIINVQSGQIEAQSLDGRCVALTVTDLQGRNYPVHTISGSARTGALSPGIYIARATNDAGTMTRKVFIP